MVPQDHRPDVDERLGQFHFWVTFLGAYLIYFPMHYLGFIGVPRRYYELGETAFVPASAATLNIFITAAALIVGAAQMVFFFNLIWSLFKGKRDGSNLGEPLRWSGKPLKPRPDMATGARSCQSSTGGLTITVCRAPSRIFCRKISPPPNECLWQPRHEYHFRFLGCVSSHRRMVVSATKDHGKALARGGRDRRHGRVVHARREDRIRSVSRHCRLPLRALDQRLLHANGYGGVEACSRAEAVMA